MNEVDPISDKFRKYLADKLSNPNVLRKMRSEICFYIETVFEDFTGEQLKQMCITKSEKGAREHGPEILNYPENLLKEKLDEVLDLIIYTMIEEYTRKLR